MFKDMPAVGLLLVIGYEWAIVKLYLHVDTLQLRWDLLINYLGW